jgi:luciferase family oxidoreductase group 1
MAHDSGDAAGIPLSVLDLSPIPSGSSASQALRETVELARTAEAAGYRRFWLAEHHNIASVTSSAPEVMIAAVAAATSTIRVGSGGIMLPNHAPLKVAETFRALAGLYGDRIDLGLGRAPGTDPRTAIALRRSREALTADDFPEQYDELVSYVDGFDEGHPFAGIVAQPDDVPLPPVWILASSYYGGQAAAHFGTGFAYAGHFGQADPAEATRIYRENFRPSGRSGSQDPHVILAAAAICAEDEERAHALARANALSMARLRSGHPAPLPSPEEAAAHTWTAQEEAIARSMGANLSVGTPEQVRDDLARRARTADADELMITTQIHDPGERRRSLELVAEAWTTASLAQV